MTVSEVRSHYLEFFKKRGHTIIPSAPIVPGNDSTTLFTSSGMQPLVPYLLGQVHPQGTKLANSQTCFRAEDIEEVGDNRHTTFFEMLGNWSLGEYFKQEQLPWFFEYLTDTNEGIGLDPNNLYVTVFAGDAESGMQADTESVEIWQRLFSGKGIDAKFVELGTEERGGEVGMQGGRIFSYGAKKNWWSRAGTPSKMPAGEPGGPDSEVFYDFGLPHDVRFGKECHPNCDCGRFIEIGNSVFMQFLKQPDGTFAELPKKNVDFGGGLERLTAATFNNPDVFLVDVFDHARNVLETRSGKKYGEDSEAVKSFRVILDHVRSASFMIADGVVPSNTEAGYVLRRLIRRAIRHADQLGIKEAALAEVSAGFGDAYGGQYPAVKKSEALIADELSKEEQKFRKTLVQGMREFEKLTRNGALSGHDAFVLFTSYGFPIEITEELAKERGSTIDLDGFAKEMEEHQAKSRTASEGRFKGGLADHSEITVRYHTSHHLLLAALRKILGTDVHQRGSNITQERVRLDFSFDRKLTPEELKQAEDIVNEKIAEALPVICTSMPKDEAEKIGAEHEFGVKYSDQVTVYSMGPKDAMQNDPKFAESFSLEFCGGPHVSNTSELATGGKRFHIVKEESVAAGVRRIKAVLE
ncbi:MAG: alanine--tRNA ligase [Candidatus Pacebacteria bacterium]|nr:alanine--tRNA ligase [Candidatus Paceibacterota bacterium]